jgi:hypothetical protein
MYRLNWIIAVSARYKSGKVMVRVKIVSGRYKKESGAVTGRILDPMITTRSQQDYNNPMFTLRF